MHRQRALVKSLLSRVRVPFGASLHACPARPCTPVRRVPARLLRRVPARPFGSSPGRSTLRL
jgi:hypothetical protein